MPSSTALSQGRRRSFSKRREFSTTRGPQTLHLSVEVHQNSVSLLFSYFEGHVDLVIPLDGDQLIRVVKRREGLGSVGKEATAPELEGGRERADLVAVDHGDDDCEGHDGIVFELEDLVIVAHAL